MILKENKRIILLNAIKTFMTQVKSASYTVTTQTTITKLAAEEGKKKSPA